VLGSESLLVDRAVAAAVDAARAADPSADVSEVEASELHPAALAELTSPSLFAAARVLVIRGAEGLAAEAADALVSQATQPQPDVAIVVVHSGGQRGKALVDRLRKAGVRVVACDPLRGYELPGFVVREARARGARMTEEAAGTLIEAVGSDLRSLAAATAQLVADTAGAEITDEVVRRYFAGRAEVTSFAVADAALAGQAVQALEQLRWALRSGVAPVLVTAALASGLRGLTKLASAPPGLSDGALARELGVPPWKIKTLRSQLRGWTEDELAEAVQAVAEADADIKGAADDPGYALEKAVLTVARARRPQRR